MICALSLIALVLLGATIVLTIALVKLRKGSERSLKKLERTWNEKFQRIEPSLAGKADSDELRNLAVMVDGVASVGLRLDRRLSALEAAEGQRAQQSGDS